MNIQPVIHPQSANGFGRRKTEKETGYRANNKLVTRRSTSSRLTVAGVPTGDNAGGNGSPLHDRLVYLTTCLIGHTVEVQVMDGSVYSGIFHATNADRDFGIILKMARLIRSGSSHGQADILDSLNRPPVKTMIIPARELVQVMAKGVSVTTDGSANEFQHEKDQEILTDSTISQSHHVEAGRELGRWVPDDDDLECPELDNIFDGPWNRGWDQFEANETLFGVKSTFNEDLYTTKLDRGPQMRELEREALRIAREIEGEDTQDLHLAEERGLQLREDYEMDEESRFSSVFRRVDDSGLDEKESIFDRRNMETFADVPGSVVSNSFTDFRSGRSIDGAQVPLSSSRDLVESAQSITCSEQYLSASENDRHYSPDQIPKSVLHFDQSRVQEDHNNRFAEYTKEELETPNLTQDAKASKHEYSLLSTRPMKELSDKMGLSPNAAAYAPTSSMSHAKNTLVDSSNSASSEQQETPQFLNTPALPGSSPSTSECENTIPASTNTRLSPSSSVGSLASERSTLNPHAKEFKFNPNAKSFSPAQTSFRPASPVSPVSDGSFYYQNNVPTVPHIHGMPGSIGMGPSFASHQPVMFNPQAAPQAYYHPNGPQYGQQMILGQPRQFLYMPNYPPEMQFKGREY